MTDIESVITNLDWEHAKDLIHILKQMKGARDHDGECSVQVGFYLKDGGFLRFGYTDDDVAGDTAGKMWIDILYPKLLERKVNLIGCAECKKNGSCPDQDRDPRLAGCTDGELI